MLVGGDGHIFVGDDVIQRDARFHSGPLHQHAVFHLRTLAHFYAAEQHAIFHLALNDAAVRHDAAVYLAVHGVAHRGLVAHLGVYRALGGEQLRYIFRAQQAHILVKVALDVIDACTVAAVFITLHMQDLQTGAQNIPLQVHAVLHSRILYHGNKLLAVHHDDAHGKVLHAHAVIVPADLRHTACIVHRKRIVIRGDGLCDLRALIYHCYIGAALHMRVDEMSKIEVRGHVAIADDNVFFLLLGQKVHNAVQCFHAAVVHLALRLRVGRHDVQAAALTNQVPLTSGA